MRTNAATALIDAQLSGLNAFSSLLCLTDSLNAHFTPPQPSFSNPTASCSVLQSMSSAAPLPHVLLAVTGSVATIKLEPLLDLLLPFCDVRVITSQRARHFFDVQRVKERVKLYQDEDEWHDWKRGDPVLHIEVSSQASPRRSIRLHCCE